MPDIYRYHIVQSDQLSMDCANFLMKFLMNRIQNLSRKYKQLKEKKLLIRL